MRETMGREIVGGPHEQNKGLIAALLYRRNGWSVIPVQAGGKVPLIVWTPYQQRIASVEEIENWFKQWPNCNLGVVTGKVSNVVVIDLDGQEGISQAMKLGLATPLISFTGKGKHLYFKWIENVKNSVRIAPGIDVRSDNGFVVVQPSLSANGKRYRWNRPLSASVVERLPPFPTALFAKDVQSSQT